MEKYKSVQERIDVKTIDRYRAALLAREVDHVSKDIIWLQQLVDDEEASAPV